MVTKKLVNDIAYEVVGCAIEVHKHMGPGLLESIYEDCMCIEMRLRGINYKRQDRVIIQYKGNELQRKFKLDLIIEDLVIAELKATETMIPLYEAQLLSHCNHKKAPKGLLINFNTLNITKSLKPIVTKYFSELPDN